jgi:hypothetical protein
MNLNDRFPITDDSYPEEIVSCTTCGAMVQVKNADTHNDWHDDISNAGCLNILDT